MKHARDKVSRKSVGDGSKCPWETGITVSQLEFFPFTAHLIESNFFGWSDSRVVSNFCIFQSVLPCAGLNLHLIYVLLTFDSREYIFEASLDVR